MLPRVLSYLGNRRCLPSRLLDPLVQSGKLYADCRGNAVFVLVAGKPNRAVGAELRGAGSCRWLGLAAGTDKDLGFFWVGPESSRSVVLCESAIDAVSCLALHPDRICISTAGVRADPRWLGALLARGYPIHCGYDADEPGDAAARRMIATHPSIERLRPPAHDWNDALSALSACTHRQALPDLPAPLRSHLSGDPPPLPTPDSSSTCCEPKGRLI